MQAGKDYFTDKAPLISLEQLDAARAAVRETGRKYMVCFSERLQSESAVYAGELIRQGAIGRVIQVLGMGPHRLNAPSRRPVFRAGPLRRHPLRHSAATRSSSSSFTPARPMRRSPRARLRITTTPSIPSSTISAMRR